MINFNEGLELPNRFSGSEKKKTIIFQDRRYLVKFPDPAREKKLETSYINNVYSEYIGSLIFKSAGMPTQTTVLGTYRLNDGTVKSVCACEDFNTEYKQLVEFNNIAISNIDVEDQDTTDINVIECNIRANYSIDDTDKTIERFWDMFIVDALIANTDRHNSNWGFMENLESHELSFAPIYDCGSALYPLLSDDDIYDLLQNEAELKNQVQNVYSCLRFQGKRINYFTFLSQMQKADCNRAMLRMYPYIDIEKILSVVDDTPGLSLVRKEFYSWALKFRYERMLMPVYRKLIRAEELHEKSNN